MKSVCNNPGCQKLVEWPERFCEKHKALREKQREEQQKQTDRFRGSPASRGYGWKWQKARVSFLRDHPVCVECGRLATDVDHIIPHKGDQKLFWDRKNWQPLCHECHSKKTAREDGGFGNK